MRKLLVFFSYIGTNYKGLQKQATGATSDLQTVQGILEYGFTKVLDMPAKFFISSRTDSGVHALESSAHIDIDEDQIDGVYSPEKICQRVNHLLEIAETDVRVKRIVEVPADFHSRQADSRNYCYRVGIAKYNDHAASTAGGTQRSGNLPISEIYRCQIIPQPFDIERVKKACQLFVGTQNFRTFMMSSSETKHLEIEHERFKKTLYKISFSRSSLPEVTNYFDPNYNKFDFYELNIESSGFLRRQVRRMMGTLIGLGQGKITEDDIIFMLQNPHEQNWMSKVPFVTGDGLFLKSVNYKNLADRIVRGPYS